MNDPIVDVKLDRALTAKELLLGASYLVEAGALARGAVARDRAERTVSWHSPDAICWCVVGMLKAQCYLAQYVGAPAPEQNSEHGFAIAALSRTSPLPGKSITGTSDFCDTATILQWLHRALKELS